MMKIARIASLGLLALAAPAIAAETPGAAAAASAATMSTGSSGASTAAGSRTAPAAEKTYCKLVEQSTGTRIRERKCLTKAEWLNLGVDLSAN